MSKRKRNRNKSKSTKLLKGKMWKIVNGYVLGLANWSGVGPIGITACTGLIETSKESDAVPFILSNLGFIAQQEFVGLIDDIEGLFANLRKSGYIDERNFIQDKFKMLKGKSELSLKKTFVEKKSEIYNLLQNACNKEAHSRRCPECSSRACLDNSITLITKFDPVHVKYATCMCTNEKTKGKRFVAEITTKDVNVLKNCAYCGSPSIILEKQEGSVYCRQCLSSYMLFNQDYDSCESDEEFREEDNLVALAQPPTGKEKQQEIEFTQKQIKSWHLADDQDIRHKTRRAWPWINIQQRDQSVKDANATLYQYDLFIYRGMPPVNNIPVEKIINLLDPIFSNQNYRNPDKLLHVVPKNSDWIDPTTKNER